MMIIRIRFLFLLIIFIIQIISGYNNNDYEDSFYVIVKHY